MTLRKIVRHPNDAILRRKALKVTSFDDKFQQLVDDMMETMIAAPGVGLAAPQVAVNQRLIVVRLPDDDESKETYGKLAGVQYVFANPKIIKASREMVDGTEGCLSIPGIQGTVERHEEVVVTGQNRYGKEQRVKAKGWLARVFQHEIDHLDGRLFIDIAKEIWEDKPQEQPSGEAEKQPSPQAEKPPAD